MLDDAPQARLAPTNFHLAPGANSDFQKVAPGQVAPYPLGLQLWGPQGAAIDDVGIAPRDLIRFPRYTGGLPVQDANHDGKLDPATDKVVGGIIGAAPQGATGQAASSPIGPGGAPMLSGQSVCHAAYPPAAGDGKPNPGLLTIQFKAGSLPPHLCWRINDLAAYRWLRAALGERRRHVVIVGAGVVGSELANDLALEGHDITLLDVQVRPLAAQLPALASQRLLEVWRGLPLRFVGNVQVAQVQRIDGMVCVTTACGQRFEVDQLIAATGLQPAGRLARSAALAVDDGGIAVDTATLRSSDRHIHALGDCASIAGRAQRCIEPIARQAQAIASAILGGGEVRFMPNAVPLRVKTGSMPFTLRGAPSGEGRWRVEADGDGDGDLRMTQQLGTETTARLQATRRDLTVRQPRLAA